MARWRTSRSSTCSAFDPLQQYMVEFDRPDDMPDNEVARVQVLRVSWDTEAKKWIYVPPPDVEEKLAPDRRTPLDGYRPVLE